MWSRARMAVVLGTIASLAVGASCRDATDITMRVTTGEKCSDLSAVQIFVGPNAGETQRRFVEHFSAASTRACAASSTPAEANLIGTLVVTPDSPAGTIIVVASAAVGGAAPVDPETCSDPNVAKTSCIIARRSFTFIDHTSLTLPIELDPLCIGQVCDPASTCYRGSCVDSTVTCDNKGCALPQETAAADDAGATDNDGPEENPDGHVHDDGGAGDLDARVLDGGGNTEDADADADADADSGFQDGDTPLNGYDASNAMQSCVDQVTQNNHNSCNYMHGNVSVCPGGYCCYCICALASSTEGTVGCKITGAMTNTCSAACAK